jgi:hypothetical protein
MISGSADQEISGSGDRQASTVINYSAHDNPIG